jgi:hypothetical protein
MVISTMGRKQKMGKVAQVAQTKYFLKSLPAVFFLHVLYFKFKN